MAKEPNIKNYTSEVTPEKSIAAIEALLVQAGAWQVSKLYAGREVVGFTFSMPVQGARVEFKLPVKVEAVEKLFTKDLSQWSAHYKARATKAKEQARRTAWRLLYDWVAVQLSMIRLGQAEVLEIFLPYAWDSRTDQTLYQAQGQNMLLALPAPAEETR